MGISNPSPPPMNAESTLTIADLSRYFHLPINDVSRELGVCTTVLKRICRQNGISRWPHRKIKSIDGLIESLEEVAATQPEDLPCIQNYLDIFHQKRHYLLQHPNVPYQQVVSKHLVNTLNLRLNRDKDLTEEDKIQKKSRSTPSRSPPFKTSPTKPISKSTPQSVVRRRGQSGSSDVLSSSQERLVIHTLANFKRRDPHHASLEDGQIFSDFLDSLNVPDSTFCALPKFKNPMGAPSRLLV